jgi:cell division protein FtsB
MKKNFSAKIFFSSKLFSFLGIIVLSFLIFCFGKKFLEIKDINQEIKSSEDQIAQLQAKSNDLNGLINFLNTDAFLEQEARLKFNLQKPGESVVIIPPSGVNQKNIEDKSSEGEGGNNNLSNPKKWWNYFFKS